MSERELITIPILSFTNVPDTSINPIIAACGMLLRDMKSTCPVDTGALRDSLTMSVVITEIGSAAKLGASTTAFVLVAGTTTTASIKLSAAIPHLDGGVISDIIHKDAINYVGGTAPASARVAQWNSRVMTDDAAAFSDLIIAARTQGRTQELLDYLAANNINSIHDIGEVVATVRTTKTSLAAALAWIPFISILHPEMFSGKQIASSETASASSTSVEQATPHTKPKKKTATIIVSLYMLSYGNTVEYGSAGRAPSPFIRSSLYGNIQLVDALGGKVIA